MKERKRLTDVMNGRDIDDLARQFDEAEAASDLATLPRGKYRCRLVDGEAVQSKSGTTGYQLTFAVVDGEHKGRRVWHTCWLTPAALPMTKRDLGKLGVTSLDMLKNPMPSGIVCDVSVVMRTDDDGTERNRVQSFDVVDVIVDPTGDDDFPSTVTPSMPAPPPPASASPLVAATPPVAATTKPSPAIGRYLPGQLVLSCIEPPKGGAT